MTVFKKDTDNTKIKFKTIHLENDKNSEQNNFSFNSSNNFFKSENLTSDNYSYLKSKENKQNEMLSITQSQKSIDNLKSNKKTIKKFIFNSTTSNFNSNNPNYTKNIINKTDISYNNQIKQDDLENTKNFIPNSQKGNLNKFSVNSNLIINNTGDLGNISNSNQINLNRYLETSINNIFLNLFGRGTQMNSEQNQNYNPNLIGYNNPSEFNINNVDSTNCIPVNNPNFLNLPSNFTNIFMNSLLEAYNQNNSNNINPALIKMNNFNQNNSFEYNNTKNCNVFKNEIFFGKNYNSNSNEKKKLIFKKIQETTKNKNTKYSDNQQNFNVLGIPSEFLKKKDKKFLNEINKNNNNTFTNNFDLSTENPNNKQNLNFMKNNLNKNRNDDINFDYNNNSHTCKSSRITIQKSGSVIEKNNIYNSKDFQTEIIKKTLGKKRNKKQNTTLNNLTPQNKNLKNINTYNTLINNDKKETKISNEYEYTINSNLDEEMRFPKQRFENDTSTLFKNNEGENKSIIYDECMSVNYNNFNLGEKYVFTPNEQSEITDNFEFFSQDYKRRIKSDIINQKIPKNFNVMNQQYVPTENIINHQNSLIRYENTNNYVNNIQAVQDDDRNKENISVSNGNIKNKNPKNLENNFSEVKKNDKILHLKSTCCSNENSFSVIQQNNNLKEIEIHNKIPNKNYENEQKDFENLKISENNSYYNHNINPITYNTTNNEINKNNYSPKNFNSNTSNNLNNSAFKNIRYNQNISAFENRMKNNYNFPTINNDINKTKYYTPFKNLISELPKNNPSIELSSESLNKANSSAVNFSSGIKTNYQINFNELNNLKISPSNEEQEKINNLKIINHVNIKQQESLPVPVFKKNKNNVKVFKPLVKTYDIPDSFEKNNLFLSPLSINSNFNQIKNETINNINKLTTTNDFNILPNRGFNLENNLNENKKYPQLCSKNLYIDNHNIENNHKRAPIKRIIREGDKIEDNFLDKKCIEICGDLLICPELLPQNCQKYINRDCDCVHKCKEKDSIYREFITSNKALTDLEF